MSHPVHVLVTGTSSGFGLLISRTLLASGHTVFATMRDPEGRNAEVAEGLSTFAEGDSGTVHVLDLDVTNDASVDGAVAQALEIGGRLDVVVNNAGVAVGGLAEAFTTEQFAKLLDLNVLGVHRVNRAVLPSMRQAGAGLLLHISSVMGRIVIPFAAPYTATKWALEGLAESLRYELAGTGVDVAIVQPGGFATGMSSRMAGPADEDRVASYGDLAKVPDQMWGSMMETIHGENAPDPQDVADVVLELIETPAGERPLRTVVDPLMGGEGPRALNDALDGVQSELLAAMGISHLRSVRA